MLKYRSSGLSQTQGSVHLDVCTVYGFSRCGITILERSMPQLYMQAQLGLSDKRYANIRASKDP